MLIIFIDGSGSMYNRVDVEELRKLDQTKVFFIDTDVDTYQLNVKKTPTGAWSRHTDSALIRALLRFKENQFFVFITDFEFDVEEKKTILYVRELIRASGKDLLIVDCCEQDKNMQLQEIKDFAKTKNISISRIDDLEKRLEDLEKKVSPKN